MGELESDPNGLAQAHVLFLNQTGASVSSAVRSRPNLDRKFCTELLQKNNVSSNYFFLLFHLRHRSAILYHKTTLFLYKSFSPISCNFFPCFLSSFLPDGWTSTRVLNKIYPLFGWWIPHLKIIRMLCTHHSQIRQHTMLIISAAHFLDVWDNPRDSYNQKKLGLSNLSSSETQNIFASCRTF